MNDQLCNSTDVQIKNNYTHTVADFLTQMQSWPKKQKRKGLHCFAQNAKNGKFVFEIRIGNDDVKIPFDGLFYFV